MSSMHTASCDSILAPRFKSMPAFQAFGMSNTAINDQWHRLHDHYTEPHRHYHTLTHLAQMFSHFDDYKTVLTHPDAVTLAIWYHDIIYNSMQPDNERQSTNYFRQQYEGYLPKAAISEVEALIMMTAGHQLDTTVSDELLHDAQYFLDMDLAILGRDWAAYEQYAKQVRLEYQHVPLADYKTGRIMVLQTFLDRERLYFSADFLKRFEAQARDNIKKEIKWLAT